MAVNFEFKKEFALQKKFTVNGKDYESLDQIPPEFRAAFEKALASGTTPTTIIINGKTFSSAESLSTPLRAIVRGLVYLALKSGDKAPSRLRDDTSVSPPGALRPEPILGVKTLVILIGLAALLFWLARSVL